MLISANATHIVPINDKKVRVAAHPLFGTIRAFPKTPRGLNIDTRG
jgi:hypothetical protein